MPFIAPLVGNKPRGHPQKVPTTIDDVYVEARKGKEKETKSVDDAGKTAAGKTAAKAASKTASDVFLAVNPGTAFLASLPGLTPVSPTKQNHKKSHFVYYIQLSSN